jgi:hypothetical protein
MNCDIKIFSVILVDNNKLRRPDSRLPHASGKIYFLLVRQKD